MQLPSAVGGTTPTGFGAASLTRYGSSTWTTTDPWPGSLPGVAASAAA